MTISQKKMVRIIAKKANLTKDVVESVINQIGPFVIEQLTNNNKVRFNDFGFFYLKTFKPKKCFNPNTGEPINIPERKKVAFKVLKNN